MKNTTLTALSILIVASAAAAGDKPMLAIPGKVIYENKLDSAPGEPAKRPYQIAMKCLEKGFYVRYGGDTIQLAPPFIVEKSQIDDLINALGEALRETD